MTTAFLDQNINEPTLANSTQTKTMGTKRVAELTGLSQQYRSAMSARCYQGSPGCAW